MNYKQFLTILFCCISWATAMSQQTSTDTLWKERLRAKGLPVPPYPSSLTVSPDGSGDYKTIQEAVNAVRDLSQERVTIHIKPGVYKEKIIIPSWKIKVALVGETNATTVITNNDFSGKEFPGGRDAFGRTKFSTYTSYTVLVQGNDFVAENITIENSAGRVGQAVALHIEGDRAIIKNCKLLGNQDTVYTATENSRQYFENCYIEGTTDFIFGEATAVFQRCQIKSLANSFVTAAATSADQKYGYVFFDCELIADTGVTKCYLGRPWRPNAKTVFIGTRMAAHILPVAWHNWGNPLNERTAFYAEFNTTGAGRPNGSRVAWAKNLTDVSAFTIADIFVNWDPTKNK